MDSSQTTGAQRQPDSLRERNPGAAADVTPGKHTTEHDEREETSPESRKPAKTFGRTPDGTGEWLRNLQGNRASRSSIGRRARASISRWSIYTVAVFADWLTRSSVRRAPNARHGVAASVAPGTQEPHGFGGFGDSGPALRGLLVPVSVVSDQGLRSHLCFLATIVQCGNRMAAAQPVAS